MHRSWLQVGFKGSNLSAEQQNFNRLMSSVREAVEWGYKDVKQTFSRLDFPRQLKVLLLPAGLLYKVAVLLVNFRCCLYGSQTSTYFSCPPPAIDIYLDMNDN